VSSSLRLGRSSDGHHTVAQPAHTIVGRMDCWAARLSLLGDQRSGLRSTRHDALLMYQREQQWLQDSDNGPN
jgi:hypothetical protein